MKPVALQSSEKPIEPSELIVTPAGAIYHLNLLPSQVAENIIVVGDQNRVIEISEHFSSVECKVSNREFVTHTGVYNGKRISAISTGIGTDNVDIVLNELDALFNINLSSRKIKEKKTSLNIVRLGTSGSLQEDIPVDSFVCSTHAVGFDGVMHFYKTIYEKDEAELLEAFIAQTRWPKQFNPPYMVKGSEALVKRIGKDMITGITATSNGFYGPQGRQLRLEAAAGDVNERLRKFTHNGLRICNYEMETSSLYGLGASLGHHTATVCAIIANRYRKEYSKDYHTTIKKLIEVVLERM